MSFVLADAASKTSKSVVKRAKSESASQSRRSLLDKPGLAAAVSINSRAPTQEILSSRRGLSKKPSGTCQGGSASDEDEPIIPDYDVVEQRRLSRPSLARISARALKSQRSLTTQSSKASAGKKPALRYKAEFYWLALACHLRCSKRLLSFSYIPEIQESRILALTRDCFWQG